MAPAIKRRKLKHDESDASDASFSDNTSDDGPTNADNLTDELDEGDSSDDAPEERPRSHSTLKTGTITKPHKRPDVPLQDGMYTAESFKSNVFKLQVDELLEQVKPKYGKKEAPAENAMRLLKSTIEQLPSRAPLSVVDAERTMKAAGVVIPFPSPRPPNDAKYTLQYERPASINAIGSYPLKTATRTDGWLAIDLMVAMPANIFQDKDYVNYRYFYKRAYYLACLAAGINKLNGPSFVLSFENLNGNQLQPIIAIRPSGSGPSDFSGSKCQINILLTLPDNLFPRTKLLPGSNCIRLKDLDSEESDKPPGPSPLYNSTLLSDASMTSYLKLLHATSEKSDAFKDACILGRIWMKQRGFGSSLRKGGFGNFEWAIVSALLLQPNPTSGPPPLSSGYSSYQLFKAMLQFLSRHDFSAKPYVFHVADLPTPKVGSGPVFFDAPRGLNVLFKMTTWSYSKLQLEAKGTVDMLSDSLFDQFDSTFILRTDIMSYRYDSTLELPLFAFGLDPSGDGYDEKIGNLCNKIYKTLTRALTDRITTVALSIPEMDAWSIGSHAVPENQQKRILVNFACNASYAHRTVDYGPAAENKQEAASFRKFWGDKAELRRFKDGSILESVIWSNKETSAPIVEQISLYILGKHFGREVETNASFTSDSFVTLIPLGRIQGQSGIAPFTVAMNAFTAVEKNIRELEELPLQIRHIRAADEQLRYASIEPPNLKQPASIVLQFEASARWPDDLCAIQRTKVAFLLKISELLSSAHPSLDTSVGLENSSQPSRNQAYLDITVRAVCIFRLRIHHDREATLLERQLKDKSLDLQSRESAATALALYKRDFIHILSHTQALQNLCTRYPALSPAIRLTKKWFASHFLLPHFTPELIELLVVRTFLQPYPWSTPSCATTGFLRTLAWIARWDWRNVPLVVDFSSTVSSNPAEPESSGLGKMKAEDMEKMQTRFEAWRQVDPAMNRVVLFAATSLHPDGNTWSDRGKPVKVVASRMTALAKAATVAIRSAEDRVLAAANGTGGVEDSFTPRSLFRSQTQDFDFVIHISRKYSVHPTSGQLGQRFKNLEIQQKSTSAPRAETKLLPLFLEDLQNIFGDTVLWFWDSESLVCVAGLWNPTATEPRAFKVKSGWNSIPFKRRSGKGVERSEESIAIQINKGAILNDIKRLGGDLITKIEVNT